MDDHSLICAYSLLDVPERTSEVRGTVQINPDLVASDGLFSSIQPCPGLVELITTAPNATARLGNFTEIPERSVLRSCSRSNGIYIFDGQELADALAEPIPLLKVRCPHRPRLL